MPKESLYQISEKLIELNILLEEEGGDISEGSKGEKVLDLMNNYELEEHGKIDAYGGFIADLTSQCKAIKDEEKRLKERRTVIENKIKRLKQLALIV